MKKCFLACFVENYNSICFLVNYLCSLFFILFFYSSLSLLAFPGEHGKRYALVIGINRYESEAIHPLKKAVNDAEAVADVLREKAGFERVITMTDEKDYRQNHYPRKENIDEVLDELLEDVYPDDFLVIFFSGHGISDANKNNYLVAVDARPGKMFEKSIRISNILAKIEKRKIQRSLLILDSCRTAFSTAKNVNDFRFQVYDSSEITAILYSTELGLMSYENSRTDYGVFTRFFLAGVKGEGDLDCDGSVGLWELYRYLVQRMRDFAMETGLYQKPYLEAKKPIYGNITLTRVGKSACRKDFDPEIIDWQIGESLSNLSRTFFDVTIPGLYQKRYRKRSADYLLFGVFLGGLWVYENNRGYRAAADSYDTRVLTGFVLPYPLDVATYGLIQEDKQKANDYATRSLQGSVFLGFLYLYHFYDFYNEEKRRNFSADNRWFFHYSSKEDRKQYAISYHHILDW